MKRQFTLGIVCALLVCRLFVGCRNAEADKALPKFAEAIVRQLIIDDINDNLEGYAEHKVMRRGDLHFAVVSTGVLNQHRDNSAVLIEAFRKYDMMDLKYEYSPRCLTVGEPITRKKVTTAVIHYRVPVITTIKENVPGHVLCDAMPNVDIDGAIKSLQAKLPEVAHDQFKLVELDTGDEQRDLFEGNIKVKWDDKKKKWVADTRSRQMGSGGEIDAEEPNWGAVSSASIDAAMKAKGFQKFNGRYVTDKALEYIRSKERGLTFRDGMWFDADLERQRIEEERLLRESLKNVNDNKTYKALADLIRQISEVKFANDALRKECKETITDLMDTIASGDLPEEQTLDDFDNISFLREWLSKIKEDERWKRIGLESFAPSLEEKIARHERRLTEDLERFRMAYGCIAAGGQRPSATQAERLKSALMPMAQKAAYADAIRQAGKYITVVQAASDILAGNVTKANLAKLPTSAIARCEQCRGTGEKVCPECHNTRVCKLCHGSRFRVVEGLKSKNNPEGLRKIPCDPVCGACKNMAARKCSACNGSGHRLDTASIDEGLRTQAERTRESISKIISVLTATLGKEKKGDGSGNDER